MKFFPIPIEELMVIVMNFCRIPVPYGHIAGKAWGDPQGKPILGKSLVGKG